MSVRPSSVCDRFSGAWLLLAALPLSAAALELELDPVVVTASRVELHRSQTGSSMSVLTRDEIRASGLTHAADLLRMLPGVAVNRSGMPGALTQVRMRGAEANHTLVLIDGVRANNPVAGSAFDFAHLLSADIERIEVLRGPQSALHGSEAIAGVISITTRHAAPQNSASVHAGYGGLRTRQAGVDVRGVHDNVDGGISVNWLDSAGDNVSRFDGERDGYRNLTLGLHGAWTASDRLRFDASARRIDGRSEFDSQDFAFPPTDTQGLVVDSDDVARIEQHYAHVQAGLSQGRWQHLARLDMTRADGEFLTDGALTSRSRGQRGKATLQTSGEPGTRQHLTLAAEVERLDYRNLGADAQAAQNQRHHDHTVSAIAEHRLEVSERGHLSASGRYDANDGFSNQASWQLGGSLRLRNDSTRLRASVGRAFKNPDFFELYGFFPGSFAGNPDLRPETSLGWDAGVEQQFADGRLLADLTWFQSQLRDEIVTVFDPDTFQSRAENLDQRSRRQGIEASLVARPLETLLLRASYTWTDSRQPDRRRELRRPRYSGGISGTLASTDRRLQLTLGASYTGVQYDAEFVSATPRDRVALSAFWLAHANLHYRLSPQWSLYGRAENLLDRDYEEQYSYRSPGRTLHAGLRWTLTGQP